MQGPLLVIGLDAAEATLLEGWAAKGELPHLARLLEAAAGFRLSSRLDLLPDAVWPELYTGRSVLRSGDFFPPAQLRSGEARARGHDPERARARTPYWELAARAGRKVAVVDQPEAAVVPDCPSFHVQEFGMHHQGFGFAARPAAAAEAAARFGRDPVGSCDTDYAFTPRDQSRLASSLCRSVERKADFVLHCAGLADWELLAVTFTEAHCAGHHLWHLHDTGHPLHPARLPPALGAALRSVYVALDAALGRLVEAAGARATVLVIVSHGMAPLSGGCEVLPELLVRLGLDRRDPLRLRVGRALPASLKRWLRRYVSRSTLDRHELGLESRIGVFAGARTRAIAVANNYAGAIRLNLVGREPEGCVRPGAEAAAILDLIEGALGELRDPRSDEAVVAQTVRTRERYGPQVHPDLPDLLVAFRRDLPPFESCVSQRVGRLVRPQPSARTGDHSSESRLWVTGPEIAPRSQGQADVLDVTPTILDLLHVAAPEELDGRSLLPRLGRPARP